MNEKRNIHGITPQGRTPIQNFYRQKCDELFNTNAWNGAEDDEGLIEHCCRIMDKHNILNQGDADEDDWLEFVYRANELLAIKADGYHYIWENGQYVLAPEKGQLK